VTTTRKLKQMRSATLRQHGKVSRWLTQHSLFGYNLRAYITLKKNIFKETKRWGKLTYKRYTQRGKRGYADSDLWNLDGYILSWLPEALDQLAEEAYSYPGGWTIESWQKWLHYKAEVFRSIRYRIDNANDSKADYVKFEQEWNDLGRMFFHLWD